MESSVVTDITTEFADLLSRTSFGERSPVRFDLFVQKLCSPDKPLYQQSKTELTPDDLRPARIFLRVGLVPFFVYILLEKRRKGISIATLHDSEIKTIATKLSTLNPPAPLQSTIKHTLFEARLGSTRRERLKSAGVAVDAGTIVPHQDANNAAGRRSKRRRVAECAEVPADFQPLPSSPLAFGRLLVQGNELGCEEQHFPVGPASMNRTPTETDDMSPTSIHHGTQLDGRLDETPSEPRNEGQQPLAGPASMHDTPTVINNTNQAQAHDPTLLHQDPDVNSFPFVCLARNLGVVFHPRFKRCIVRNGLTAVFEPSFPPDPAKCCFEMDIQGHHAVLLAWQLYGVHIEELGKERWQIYESGAQAKITESLTLEDMQPENVGRHIGNPIQVALTDSISRQREVYNGLDLTRCVQLTIPASPAVPLRLKVMTHPSQLSILIRQLSM